jgi:hypothetical protein
LSEQRRRNVLPQILDAAPTAGLSESEQAGEVYDDRLDGTDDDEEEVPRRLRRRRGNSAREQSSRVLGALTPFRLSFSVMRFNTTELDEFLEAVF